MMMVFGVVLFPIWVLASDSAKTHESNPSPGLSLIFQEINFIILVVGLYILLKKPVSEFFLARAAQIKQSIEKNRIEHNKILAENKEIRTKLQSVDAEAVKMLNFFKDEANAEHKKIMEHAGEFSEKIVKDTQRIVQSEIQRANEELKNLTIQLTREMAQSIILKEMSSTDEETLTQNFISRLKDSKA